MVWIWPSGDLRSVSRVFQWSCVYCVTQSRNPHRTLKDKAVSDSMFHPVSSSNWESFVLSAESQARGGGGGIGGMTQKTFFYKNVAYQIVMYFFFLLINSYLIYLLIHFPYVSQPMVALGGFYFEASRMFFTSLCRVRGLPPPSHLQTVGRKIKTRRPCPLRIDNWTPRRATNTKEAQGRTIGRSLRRCKKMRIVWKGLLCLHEQEKVARGKPWRISVLPQRQEQAGRGRAASHIWETLSSAGGTRPGAPIERTFCVRASILSSMKIWNCFIRCLNEFWVKAEKALKAERRTDGLVTGRAPLSVAWLPDHTKVHSVVVV